MGWPLGVWSCSNVHMGNTNWIWCSIFLLRKWLKDGGWTWEKWEASVMGHIVWNSHNKNIMLEKVRLEYDYGSGWNIVDILSMWEENKLDEGRNRTLHTIFCLSSLGLSAAHTDCLLGSGCLYPSITAVFGDHLMVLASPTFWGLLLLVNCTFTNSISWALFRDNSPAIQWQPLAVLHDPFITSKLVSPGRVFSLSSLAVRARKMLAASGT